ncbi:MAG: hypothetical protein BGO98_40000 [Myxococcales bacterium 68-20]|nr:cadherin-like domain-containing protein [Myxococcales bacterium]OJY19285.1 MAG: hypothetical protein BGO98_40000 [Myxococcales bacterium 68-20]
MTSARALAFLAAVPVIMLSGVLASACGSSDVAAGDNSEGADVADATDAADAYEASTPTATDDTFSGVEDQLLSTPAPGVLANDVDGLVVPAIKTTAAGGTVTLAADGAFEYQPPANFFGDDSFTYELDSSPPKSATVTLAIVPVNDPPTIAAPANVVLDSEPGAVTAPGWLPSWTRGPTNEAAQNVTFTLVPKGTPGVTFSVAPTLDTATGTLSLSVAPGSFGSAQYSLEVRDDGGTAHGGKDVVTADFAITVNTPPTAADDSVSDSWGKTCIRLELTANDTDIDGDTLGVQITDVADSGKIYVYDPSKPDGLGTQLVVGNTGPTGSVCYKPNSRFFVGVDRAKYRAVDGRGGRSNEAVVTITVIED